MQIQRMTASFGKLQNRTLTLNDGLNILEAPNESGKSTWCAFLLSMLYGINSRERDRSDSIADKNRYAPWGGAAMAGRLDCTTHLGELTLLRETRRPNAPMADFSAFFSGTREEVPGLTAQNCGEELLGIPREVFSRSALIRQAGLPVTADAELERRIVSLITSGEEGLSYTEVAAALRRQLNRRRHHQTGEIPALDARLEAVRSQQEALARQQDAFREAQDAVARLQSVQAEAERQLRLREAYDAAQARRAQQEAADAASAAEAAASALGQQLEAQRIPENDAISRLRGAIVNLQTTRRAAEKARSERDEAAKALLRAEAAVNDTPFTGLTPQQAEKLPLGIAEKPRFPLWAALLTALLGAGFGALIFLRTQNLLVSIGGGCGLFGSVMLISGLAVGRKQRRWEEKAETLRRQRSEDLKSYTVLYQAQEAARAEAAARSASAEALTAAVSSNEQAILLEVRRFAPDAFDIPAADAALRACAAQRRQLAQAEAAAREAQLRRDLLPRQGGEVLSVAEETPSEPPAYTVQELRSVLEEARFRLSKARSEADRLEGQLAAAGDPAALEARQQELQSQRDRLQQEYHAISIALDTLAEANTELQSRFSPELGRRAGEILAELTEGRYSGVALDRAFRFSAEPQEGAVFRDAQLLSAGTADQLYLAVRLAICELVLPADRSIPLILDDALANFDDARCAAALRFLRREAEHRQILLFTCHSRERTFLEQDGKVSVQRLTV